MNSWYELAILSVVQAILAGIITHVIKIQIEKKQAVETKQDEARLKRDKLILQATIANSELSYAVVAAIKRGTPNGEIEIAEKAYHEAIDEYKKFIQEQAIEKLA